LFTDAAAICTHTPSWVRPGTSCCKIHPSAGRTREQLHEKDKKSVVITSEAWRSHLSLHFI
jgi:hypothetical protein